jgi:hypothetical protein
MSNSSARTASGELYQVCTSFQVSVGHLDEDGYPVLISGGELAIREPGGILLAKVKRSESHLYLFSVRLSSVDCLVLRGDALTWWWHECLGHLNFPAIKKMEQEELVRGLLALGSADHLCEAC